MKDRREDERRIQGKRYEQRRKIQRLQRKIIIVGVIAFVCGVLCGKIVFANGENEKKSAEVMINTDQRKAENQVKSTTAQENKSSEKEAWNLVLVNSTHYIEDGYEPMLSEVEDHYQVDYRIAEELQQMLADGREEGLDFIICSAYRTMEKQTELFEAQMQSLVNEKGMSSEEAYAKAGTSVAYPGTSEHQIGLAVDIVARDYQLLDEAQAETPEAEWLKEHCWEYGFILRYPLDKTEKTGIIFEPWHYRYVGKKAAKEIMEHGICLEEYLQMQY